MTDRAKIKKEVLEELKKRRCGIAKIGRNLIIGEGILETIDLAIGKTASAVFADMKKLSELQYWDKKYKKLPEPFNIANVIIERDEWEKLKKSWGVG